MQLRYGINPQEGVAQALPAEGQRPVTVLNGEPSAINLLDALNAWQLVRELDHAFGVAAAASFKHVSPAGAAIGLAVDEATAATYDVDPTGLTELATAYVRARQTDPKSSYGDVAALSRPVDLAVAQQLAGVVSDAVIAPGYTPEALEVLCRKKRGAYLIVEIDADFQPPAQQHREIYGVRLALQRDRRSLDLSDVDNVVCGELGEPARRDALVAMIVARYTQSNSVVYTHQGQTVGVAAGQQARVDSVKLAGVKADTWWLRHHPRLRDLSFSEEATAVERHYWRSRLIDGDLDITEQQALKALLLDPQPVLSEHDREAWRGAKPPLTMASDGFLPFPDNIHHAARYGVRTITEPGGAMRTDQIIDTCRRHNIALIHTGIRLFHH